MSRNPGIGALSLVKIENELTQRKGAAWLSANGDVPNEIGIDGRTYPIGRYLVGKLRDSSGMAKGLPSKKAALNQIRRETRDEEKVKLKRQTLSVILAGREKIKSSKRKL